MNYFKFGRFFTFTYLFVGSLLAWDSIIYQLEVGENKEVLIEKFSPQLNSYELDQVNSQLSQKKFFQGKEFFVHVDARVTYCEFDLYKGAVLTKIFRKYGYRAPFGLGLIDYAKYINPDLNDFAKLPATGTMKFPILYVQGYGPEVEEGVACNEVFELDKQSPFLIRGRDSYISKDKKTFYQGRSFAQLKTEYKERTVSSNPVTVAEVAKANEGSKERTEESIDEIVEKLDSQGAFKVRFGAGYDSIHGAGANSTVIVSKLRPAAGITWEQMWSASWVSFIDFEIQKGEYLESNNVNRSIVKRSQSQTSFGIGLQYVWSKNNLIQLALKIKEYLYYRRTAETIFTIKKENSFEFGLDLQKQIIRRKKLSFSLLGGASLVAGGSLDYKGGENYRAGARFTHDLGKFELGSNVVYEIGNYETRFYSYTNRDLKFFIDLKVGF